MKHIALVLVVLVGAFFMLDGAASAEDSQVIEVLIGKILESYTVATDFGNVYFNPRDIRRLVNAAAKLRPVLLGTFTTDEGQVVKVRAQRFDRGMVTLIITH